MEKGYWIERACHFILFNFQLPRFGLQPWTQNSSMTTKPVSFLSLSLHINPILVNYMAVISMFYGLIISMYYLNNKKHHLPHIHVRYQENEAVISIPEGDVLEGNIPANKLKLVLAWVEIHRDELMADWDLASRGEAIFRIDPLK
ncbi:MAG: DUF4160 domain-containing protein [Bacteroidales bacterium]|nr:DUF4160 domain-containing protein [Bacteroidales bacterium]